MTKKQHRFSEEEMKAAWEKLSKDEQAKLKVELSEVGNRAKPGLSACLDGCAAMIEAMYAHCDMITPGGSATQACYFAAEQAGGDCVDACYKAHGVPHK